MDSAKESRLVVLDCFFKPVAFALRQSKLVSFFLSFPSMLSFVLFPMCNLKKKKGFVSVIEYAKQNCNCFFFFCCTKNSGNTCNLFFHRLKFLNLVLLYYLERVL